MVDDEEGMIVAAVKAETPFGTCGLMKGDVIQAIDDVRAGNSEQFRSCPPRLARQGDCLLTIARGAKTLDLPVYFPSAEIADAADAPTPAVGQVHGHVLVWL